MMAEVTIDQLPPLVGPLALTDIVEVEQANISRKANIEQLAQPIFDEFADSGAGKGVNLVENGDFSKAKSKLALFVTAQSQTLESLFSNAVRFDIGFGLTANNPNVNNRIPLQQLFDAAAANGVPIDGFDVTLYCDYINFPSGLIFKRVNIISTGSPDGPLVPKSHVSTGRIDGIVSPVKNIIGVDVSIDGNRSAWPNIAMSTPGPEGGGGEDGGLHAWRIVGDVQDCLFVRCKGINAGTAGWALHNPLPSTSAVTYTKRNLMFIDCEGVGNREHGMFADDFNGIKWIGGRLTSNGLDLNGTDPLVSGTRGARDTNGKLFGCPFDLEAYGPNFLGSMFTDFLIQSCDMRNNAIMAIVYNPIASDTAGYISSRNIRIIDCELDSGLASGADRPAGLDGVALNVLGNLVTVPPFNGVSVHSRLNGRPQLNGATAIDISSGFINSVAPKAILNNCSYYDISAPSLVSELQIFPVPSATVTITAGTPGAIVTKTLVSTTPKASGGLAFRYDFTVTGALATNGTLVLQVAAPATYNISGVACELVNISTVPTPSPVASTSVVNGVGPTASLFISTVGDPSLSGSLKIEVLPKL